MEHVEQHIGDHDQESYAVNDEYAYAYEFEEILLFRGTYCCPFHLLKVTTKIPSARPDPRIKNKG